MERNVLDPISQEKAVYVSVSYFSNQSGYEILCLCIGPDVE